MTYGVHLGVSVKRIVFADYKNREFLGKLKGEYAVNLYSGYIWKNDKKYQKIGKSFSSGDVIEIIFENGNLYFKSGSDKILAFKGIQEGLYPALIKVTAG